MGFFNSLKGQLGRDTGRLISNKLFGNRHSSKYQSITDSRKISKSLKQQNEYQLEFLKIEQNNEIELLRRKKEMLDLEEKKAFVKQNLKKITSLKIPTKKELLIDELYNLSLEITSNKWKSPEEEINKISNIYTDAVLKKYELCLFTLKTKFPNTVEILYFEKQYKKFQKQAFFQKCKLIFIAMLLIGMGGIVGYLEKDKPKETPIIDFLKSLTEKTK